MTDARRQALLKVCIAANRFQEAAISEGFGSTEEADTIDAQTELEEALEALQEVS